MTNKELLERCAKVMGYHLSVGEFTGNTYIGNSAVAWNPLTSVADAADMAVKMKVCVEWLTSSTEPFVHAWYSKGMFSDDGVMVWHDANFKDHPTEQAAYCYAVCSVVAQMGGE